LRFKSLAREEYSNIEFVDIMSVTDFASAIAAYENHGPAVPKTRMRSSPFEKRARRAANRERSDGGADPLAAFRD
jgi:hypothetical protein